MQNELCAQYSAKFVAQQQSNIKQMLENEDFQRLPLPANYSIHKEMLDSINMYPDQDEMRKNVGVFAPQESGGVSGANILAQFSNINPFLKLKFVAELEATEEARLKIRLKEIQDQIRHTE